MQLMTLLMTLTMLMLMTFTMMLVQMVAYVCQSQVEDEEAERATRRRRCAALRVRAIGVEADEANVLSHWTPDVWERSWIKDRALHGHYHALMSNTEASITPDSVIFYR